MNAAARNALDRIASVRQDTIRLYAEMARLTDAESVGFKVREPGAPDVTLMLIERALRDEPAKAKAILRRVADNDANVVALTREMLEAA